MLVVIYIYTHAYILDRGALCFLAPKPTLPKEGGSCALRRDSRCQGVAVA